MSETLAPTARGIHLTQDMKTPLLSIPKLYFVAIDDEADIIEDPYLQATLPATSRWDHRVRCFLDIADAAAATPHTTSSGWLKPNVRIFSVTGWRLARWFNEFILGPEPLAIENIPIDFNFVVDAERICPRGFRATPLNTARLNLEPTLDPTRKILMTGAHGAGKSTLAKELSGLYSLPIVQSYAGQIQKLWGATADVVFPFERRLLIQRHILMKWRADYVNAFLNGGGIFDRTAYDIAAYLLADVDRNVQDGAVNDALRLSVSTAMAYMNEIHDDPNATVVFVPLLASNQSTYRGPYKGPDGAYATLHDLVIRGLIAKQDLVDYAPIFLRYGEDDVEYRLAQIAAGIGPIDRRI